MKNLFLMIKKGSTEMPPADPEAMKQKMESMLDQMGAAKGISRRFDDDFSLKNMFRMRNFYTNFQNLR